MRTVDGKASGSLFAQHPNGEIEIALKPALPIYRGQLLDFNDQPIARRSVRLTVQLSDDGRASLDARYRPSIVNVDQFEVTTNKNGFFQFRNLPQLEKMALSVQVKADENRNSIRERWGRFIGYRTIHPNEESQLDVIRISLDD